MLHSSAAANPPELASGGQLPTITVIGGGFSGTLVVVNLLRSQSGSPLRILYVDRSIQPARGVAYSTPCPLHLLNIPAGKMSAFPDQPDHFLQWAQQRDASLQAGSFVPRMLYGEYLQHLLDEAATQPNPAVNLARLNAEAIALQPNPPHGGARITLSTGEEFHSDAVVLAVGNYPPANPPVVKPDFYTRKRYIADPWAPKALADIPPEAPVFIIGTGLTMVDKTIELKQQGHQGPLYAVSRRGLLPVAHQSGIPPLTLDFSQEDPVTALKLFKRLRHEVRHYAQQGGSNWRAVMDAFRPYTQDFWKRMSSEEQARFLRHARPYWDVHRHRIAPRIADMLNGLLADGQLQIIAGRIQGFEEQADHVDVLIQPRGNRPTQTIAAGVVINCSGSGPDFKQRLDPLTQNLLQQGLIVPSRFAMGLEADDTGALLDAHGTASDVLFTLGPPLKGLLWETTAVPEIRQQAITLALHLLQITKIAR